MEGPLGHRGTFVTENRTQRKARISHRDAVTFIHDTLRAGATPWPARWGYPLWLTRFTKRDTRLRQIDLKRHTAIFIAEMHDLGVQENSLFILFGRTATQVFNSQLGRIPKLREMHPLFDVW